MDAAVDAKADAEQITIQAQAQQVQRQPADGLGQEIHGVVGQPIEPIEELFD